MPNIPIIQLEIQTGTGIKLDLPNELGVEALKGNQYLLTNKLSKLITTKEKMKTERNRNRNRNKNKKKNKNKNKKMKKRNTKKMMSHKY